MLKFTWAVTGLALALGGCATQLDSRPDQFVTASKRDALEGVPYALPMLQYEVETTRSIAGCQTEFDIEAGRKTYVIVRGAPSLALQAKATDRYIPGERYIADYRALNQPFSTAALALELDESGLLKSVNASAEDQSAEAFASVVKIGLNVASLASPVKGIGSQPAPFTASRGRVNPLETLSAAATKTQRVVCTSDTLKAVIEAKVNSKAQKTEAGSLRVATKDVERLTTVANLRRAQTRHVDALSDALQAQAKSTMKIEDLKKTKDDLVGDMTVVTKTHWPRAFDDYSGGLAMAAPELDALKKKLEVREVLVLTPADVAAWIATLPLKQQAKYREDERFKPYLKDDGTPVKEVEISGVCGGAKPDLDACLRSRFDGSIWLSEAGTGPVGCDGTGRQTFCLQTAMDVYEIKDQPNTNTQSRPPTSPQPVRKPPAFPAGRHAYDNVADAGVFVRTPVEGRLRVCRGAVETCTGDDEILRSDPIRAPQLGQLRFLPFRNEMFEGSSLSLTLRQNGTIEKLDYKKTKAGGTTALAAAASAVEQYKTWRDTRETAAGAKLTADRAAQIAAVQFDIDLLTKQQALLKLQTPETPDALQAVRDQTAALEVEIALKEARIADLKAAATLADLEKSPADAN